MKKHIDNGYRPILVCSAMGKTTNTLLSSAEFALQGQVFVDSIRTMHLNTVKALNLGDNIASQINDLIDELERLLEGIKYIGIRNELAVILLC